jgi:uncharacterized protein (DUF697 family)
MVESALRSFFESASTDLSVAPEAEPRGPRADSIIRKYVLFSSGAGLIPIPLADVAAVTGVQVAMLRDLTKLYGSELSERMLENFVTALTGGMLARIGASAVKAIPGIGTFLGGASMSIMSGASTYAVGRVAKNHLEKTGSLANVDMNAAKREYSSAYESGKDYVANLDKDKEKDKDEDKDVISKLERLGKLRDQGVLTEDEFQAEKARVLKK